MTNEQRMPAPVPIRFDEPLDPRIREMAMGVEKYHPHLYKQRFIYTSTSAAAAMAVGRTNTLGGSGDQIYLDSTSTKDILAGSAVTSCKTWFLNTNSQYEIKTTNMGGTTSTKVDSAAMQYCDHWATSWGGLYDAEGNILLIGSGETFGTITAAANETVNATFWIAKYWRAKPIFLKIGHGAQAISGSLVDSGVITYPVYYCPGVEENQDTKTYETFVPALNPESYQTYEPWGSPVYGNDLTASRVQIFQGILVTDEVAETHAFQIDWLMWRTRTSASWGIQYT